MTRQSQPNIIKTTINSWYSRIQNLITGWLFLSTITRIPWVTTFKINTMHILNWKWVLEIFIWKSFERQKKTKEKKKTWLTVSNIQPATKNSKIKQIRNSYYAKPVMTRGISVCQCLVPTKSDLESTKVSSIYKFQTQIISLIFYVSNLYVNIT